MATIVYQTNKKTSDTYAYESITCWDKEKQQSRGKRIFIGRVDSITKQIVPNLLRKKPLAANRRVNRVPDGLQTCFSYTWRKILSIVYYLIIKDRNPLSFFPRWATTHWHPHGSPIFPQRSSELFAAITEAERQRLFELQGQRRVEKEYLAYDSTSVSSYSKCLKKVRYGKNKDHGPLAQINLASLFGQHSRLPF